MGELRLNGEGVSVEGVQLARKLIRSEHVKDLQVLLQPLQAPFLQKGQNLVGEILLDGFPVQPRLIIGYRDEHVHTLRPGGSHAGIGPGGDVQVHAEVVR